jgi:hypothetical protein
MKFKKKTENYTSVLVPVTCDTLSLIAQEICTKKEEVTLNRTHTGPGHKRRALGLNSNS